MIKQELYRAFIKNRFILLVLFFMILKLISLAAFESCINTDIELVHDSYVEYISPFEGKLTQYTIDTIAQAHSSLIAAGEEYTALKADYESGKISSEEYSKKAAELNDILKNKEVISLAYEQLDFVRAEPRKRYFIYSNGWEAFLANEKLDYALAAAVIMLALFLFVQDHDANTYPITACARNGRSRVFYLRQMILAAFIILINVLLMSEEMLFYSIRYGLPHFDAPIQSLISFRCSPFHINIIEAVVIITLFKIACSVLLAELTILAGYIIKRLWITAAVSGAVVFIPYAVFNNKLPRYFFQPLGYLLGNGYIKGKCEPILRDGLLISEPFEGIGQPVLFGMLIAVAAVTFIIFFISLKMQMLNENKLSLGKFTIAFIISAAAPMLLTVFLFISSREDNTALDSVYSKGMGFSDKQYCYFNDESLTATDYSTGETFNVIRDVMKDKNSALYYVSDGYIYYMLKDAYSGLVSYYRIDKSSYEEELIYRELKGIRMFKTDSKYLGLINTINISNMSSDYYENEEISAFWVDDKYIFTADANGINMIDTDTGAAERIIEAGLYPECLAYNSGVIYYADRMNNVFSYDVKSGASQRLDIKGCKMLFIADGELIVIDLDYHIGVYRDSVLWIENASLAPTSYVTASKDGIVFVNADGQIASAELDDLSVRVLTDDINAFNAVAFENTSEIYAYIGSGQDYTWELISAP